MIIPLGDVTNRPGAPKLATWVILLLNIVVFFYEIQVDFGEGERALAQLLFRYGTVPAVVTLPPGREILHAEMRVPQRDPSGRVVVLRRTVVERISWPHWQGLLTSMFLHGSLIHLLGNMLFFWIFADNLEDMLGTFGFVIFYLACGVISALAEVALHPHSTLPVIGASGAIAGVLGAYTVLFPWNRIRTFYWFFFILVGVWDIPALYYLGFWFIAQFFLGLVTATGIEYSGVAYMAHVGGFLAGLILILVLPKREKVRRYYQGLRGYNGES